MNLKHLNSIPFYELKWLLVPESDVETIGDPAREIERINYPLAESLGTAWVDKLQAGNDITLYHAHHDLTQAPGQLLPLLEVDIATPENTFNAQIWISGSCCHREYWQGRNHPPVDILAHPGRDTFRHHQEWHGTILMEGGVVSSMKSFTIPEAGLCSLLGEHHATTMLARLGLNPPVLPTVVLSMPTHISSPLREAFQPGFHGPSHRLFAQARILNYLAGLYDHLTVDTKPKRERRHTARIRDLRDYLMHLEGQVPTLNDLSKDFGLSARTLNAEFTAEYGQSIASFILDYRLTQAHAAIKEGSIPLKLLAARLGYSHVNHFITTFKKKFGYPPGSLRKK